MSRGGSEKRIASPFQQIGRRLLSLSNRLFRHWHRVRDGTLEWSSFQERMSRLRREVKQALEEGSRCSCAKTAATCFEILKVEEGLWTFARVEGVEPTNNAVGARAAPCGDLASDQRRDRQRATGAGSWSGC